MGLYSMRKTTFRRHLMKKGFLGIRIGPSTPLTPFFATKHSLAEDVVLGDTCSL